MFESSRFTHHFNPVISFDASFDNRFIPLPAPDQNAGKRAGKINIVRLQFNGFTEGILSLVRPVQVITEKCSNSQAPKIVCNYEKYSPYYDD
jgi:hypothetical protein